MAGLSNIPRNHRYLPRLKTDQVASMTIRTGVIHIYSLTLCIYMHAHTSRRSTHSTARHTTTACYAVRISLSWGLALSRPILSSSEPVLDILVKLQLSAVGVKVPEFSSELLPAVWKSPNSPKSPKLASPASGAMVAKLKGSDPLAAAASEKGPKAS